MHELNILIVCLLLIITVTEVRARIYQKNVRVRHSPALAHFDPLMDRGFGFQAGGELHFSLQCPVSASSHHARCTTLIQLLVLFRSPPALSSFFDYVWNCTSLMSVVHEIIFITRVEEENCMYIFCTNTH